MSASALASFHPTTSARPAGSTLDAPPPPLAYSAPVRPQAVRGASWPGVDVIEWTVSGDRVEACVAPSRHLVLMVHAGRRQDGETRLGTGLRSSLHDMAGTVSVVPAGTRFEEWHRPVTSLRLLAVLLDPAVPFLDGLTPEARLFDADVRFGVTMMKLRTLLDAPVPAGQLHAETLATLLAIELRMPRSGPGLARGGLTGRNRRIVCDYIEAHLDEDIPLGTLAALVGISPFHLCRAFKAETGLPPHRWQIRRRVERAKEMLADPRRSVMEIAFDLGFGSSSHFAYRFRQETGTQPTQYRRSLLAA